MAATIEDTKPLISKSQRHKRKRIQRLSIPMIDHLLSYCAWAEDDGSYYGNEAQFRKRHNRIKRWLQAIRDRRIDHET